MDGTMNKDVKIGLAIGLLALIALFCLFVFKKSPPPTETETVQSGTEQEVVLPAEELPPATGLLPGHGSTVDSDDLAVATLGGRTKTPSVDIAPGHVRVGEEEELIDLPRAVNPDMTRLIDIEPPEIDRLRVETPPAYVTVVTTRTYVAQNNDSFTGISKREYGTTRHWRKIMEANGMTNPLSLRAGQEIIIPPLTDLDRTGSGTTTHTETVGADGRKHKVARGETLGDISTKYYGTTRHYKVIMQANNITDERSVPADRVLVIPDLPEQSETPAPRVIEDPAGARTVHVVRQGETLTEISRKYYGTVRLHKLIMEANGIADPTRVRIGQRLVIPPKPADVDSGASMAGSGLRPGEQSYVVREGDTLIDIARQFYRDSRHYDLIMKRNGIVRDRDLRAGSAIIIPPLSERSVLMETRATD